MCDLEAKLSFGCKKLKTFCPFIKSVVITEENGEFYSKWTSCIYSFAKISTLSEAIIQVFLHLQNVIDKRLCQVPHVSFYFKSEHILQIWVLLNQLSIFSFYLFVWPYGYQKFVLSRPFAFLDFLIFAFCLYSSVKEESKIY